MTLCSCGLRALGWQLQLIEVGNESEIDTAFANAKWQANAVIVSTDPFFRNRHEQIVAQAARRGLPTSYFAREFVTAGASQLRKQPSGRVSTRRSPDRPYPQGRQAR